MLQIILLICVLWCVLGIGFISVIWLLVIVLTYLFCIIFVLKISFHGQDQTQNTLNT